MASASVAQSAAAAAIWMWAAGEDWRPLGKLPGATLDVVALDFAGPCSGRDCLLAASRDRHVALYAPVNPSSQGLGVWGDAGWTLVSRVKASPKALYDAGWAPGDADAFVDADALEALGDARIQIIPGADHFFSGRWSELATGIEDALQQAG